MSIVGEQFEEHPYLQGQLGLENMNVPEPDPSPSDLVALQIGAYRHSGIVVVNRGGKWLTWHDRLNSDPRIVVHSFSDPTEYNAAWTSQPLELSFESAMTGASIAVQSLADEALERDWPVVTTLYSFSLDEVRQELQDIREEVEETCAVANDVRAAPESAYDETLSLLERMPGNIPMPDIMWLEDGGIGLEWRPEDGIVTMSLYGDNHITIVVILGDQREIAGTCSLSDNVILPAFLTIIHSLFP